MTTLVLERRGFEVFFEGRKLTVIAQASKGAGKEVVKIDGLPGSNGQKFVSLSKLVEGYNELDCQAKATTKQAPKQQYVLTAEEQAQVDELQAQIGGLQAQIDAIIDAARARYIPNIDLSCDISQMSDAQREAMATQLEAIIARFKAGK